MAKVEDLIKNIPDARLRDEIAREVIKLKSQKKFGLVFEEHLPEQVLLPSLPIKPGARFRYRCCAIVREFHRARVVCELHQ